MVGTEDERLMLILRYFSICFHIPLCYRDGSTNGHLVCTFTDVINIFLKIGYLQPLVNVNMSLIMRKLDFCICENKDADQLRENREADQHLCFRYIDSTIPLLPKS